MNRLFRCRLLGLISGALALAACGGGPTDESPVDQEGGNRSPIVNFNYTIVDSMLMLDASASYDPDGDPLTYLWDLGNGENWDEIAPSTPISPEQSIRVELKVSDGQVTATKVLQISAGSSPAPLPMGIGDPDRGKTLYESGDQACALCHGNDGQSAAFKAINSTAELYSHSNNSAEELSLATYIETLMPQGGIGKCDTQCAIDISAYIRSWSGMVYIPPNTMPTATPLPSVTPTPGATPIPMVTVTPIPTVTPTTMPSPAVTPLPVTIRVEVEDYLTFNDATPENLGGEYRSDAVDIEVAEDSDGGFSVGYIENGEWLEFIVDVPRAASYYLDFRVASLPGGGTISVDVGGNAVAGDTVVPSTGGWQQWRTITKSLGALQAGERTIRLRFGNDGAFNLNWFELVTMSSTATPLPTPSPTATPGPTPTPSSTPTSMPTPSSTPTSMPTSSPTPTANPTPTVTPSPSPAKEDYLAGVAVYNQNCAGCHGVIESSEKRDRSQAQISGAISGVSVMQGISLSAEELRVLEYALNNPNPDDLPPVQTGEQLFSSLGCVACHGNDGQQESQPIVFDNYSYDTFLTKIETSMPPADPGSCVGECAELVATYAWSLKPEVSCDVEQVLPRRVRQLSKFEYINTINQLFNRTDGDTLASGVGSSTEVRGFDNNAESNKMSIPQMDAYWTAAGNIVSSANFDTWLSTDNCSETAMAYCFTEKFGREAFRRNLNTEEQGVYQSLFEEGGDDTEGARIVAQTMLVSPNFLYRTELGLNGQLSQFEIASLLSYTFWGSMPDTVLLNRAASNELSTAAQLRQEVERLVADSKARQQFVHFGRQWLELDSVANLDRDDTLFPTFTSDVAAAMDQELELFLAEIMLQDGYTMADFFQSDFVFANNDLAGFYGLSGVNGSEMQRVNSNASRGGLLSMGALLARNAKFDDSHPIKRGLLVRRNLLCQEFGIPPAVIGEVEPFDPDKPTRERFAAHTANEACASCHQFIDEVGFAFENYDAVGKYRLTEGNNLTIDATGSISGLERMTDSDTHNFSNLQGLSSILAGNGLQPASECFVETFQRMMDGVAEPDTCATNNIATRWTSGSIKDLWIEMVVSQSFSQRQ